VARARNIKPGLFKNEVLGVADPLYTLLFEGLWLLADRAGRMEDRPLRIKAEIFPYREGLDVVSMLSWLEDAGFIHRYSANGLALIQIDSFTKHQSPHKNEPDSVLPCPDEIGSTPEIIGSTRADCGLLTADSGLRIVQPPAAIPTAKAKKPKSTLPDGFGISDAVRAWADERGYGQLEQHLEAFKRKATAKGYTYVDWDAAFMEAIREDWAKLRGRERNGAAPPPESKPSTGPDPALKKIAEDAKRAAAPSLETLARMAELRKPKPMEAH
jgi:hypothetical protein